MDYATWIQPHERKTYPLTTWQAVRRIHRDVRTIIRELPRKPLHEISSETIINTARRVLGEHPDFQLIEKGGRQILIPCVKGRQAYAHYEIGQRILSEIVISELMHEHDLSERHAELMRKLVGKLFCLRPVSIQRQRQSALNKLIKELGADQTEKLLVKTNKLWHKHATKYLEIDSGELGDMFVNTSIHLPFFLNTQHADDKTPWIASAKELLKNRIEIPPRSLYKDHLPNPRRKARRSV